MQRPRLSWGWRFALAASGSILAGCGGPKPGAVVSNSKAVAYEDVTGRAGIDFHHDNGGDGRKLFPEIMGSGAAFLDADGNGFQDLILVNCSPLPGSKAPHPALSRLYLNNGDGTFRDATKGSGLDRIGYGLGVSVGDVDNDGRDDVYVTRLGTSSLYRNTGEGHFREVAGSGLDCPGFSTSAAFLDYDRDGRLDLYVCRYVPWKTPKDDFVCKNSRGEKQYCSVHVYPGQEHRLYRNLGAMKFQDVTRAAGIAGKEARGLAIVCGDYDRDGDTDIFVANDETPNFLWQNQGNGKFLEIAAAVSFAYNERGASTAGMGLDMADADGDGSDDVIESDFQGQKKTLYVNDGQGLFTPNAGNKGVGAMTLQRLGFGIGFLDFDLDSWPDIFIANGHVNEMEDPNSPYHQTAQLFRNTGGAIYADAAVSLGTYGTTPYLGRGCAFGDYDNDGGTDIVVINNGGPAVLLHNSAPRKNHWIGLRCIGRKSNRSAFGARVTVTAGARTQSREIRAARSYLSSSDSRLLLGLGVEQKVARLQVQWPSGAVQEWTDLPTDRYLTITEGESEPR